MNIVWERVGLNVQEEWIEENSQTLQRRVVTPAGMLPEPAHKDLRWGRVTSKDEAATVAKALSYAHLFQSYESLAKAAQVWMGTSDASAIQSFKKRVEKAMAERVWDAMVNNRWSSSLPDWSATLERPGSFDWPLWLDVGLYKTLYPHTTPPTLSQYNAWVNEQAKKGTLTIGLNVPSGVSIGKWTVAIKGRAPQTLSVEQWAGVRPPLGKDDVWTNGYVPFSALDNTVSGYVDPLLNQALQRAHPDISPVEVRTRLGKELNIPLEELSVRLSNDQLDAVWLALQQLEKGQSFLLGDETGYGKGRILAALAKVAHEKNIQILFFTEKKALLSDFYRDCAVLFDDFPLPTVLHSSARVLSPSGELAVPTKNNRLPQKGDAWVWTTYSQFNRNNEDKLEAVCAWVSSRPTWILMDEAQNAAGNSNTSKSLKKIQKAAKGLVFSSATFAKNEEQLHAYQRLFTGKKYEWERLLSAFASDSDALRAAITLQWAEQGVFLRREHPPMSLPHPHWIPINHDLQQQNQVFAEWWRLMLETAKLWNKGLNRFEGAWAKLGGHLSRASREFSLLQKTTAVVANAIQSVQQGQKPVIVADWTLSSHVARLVNARKNEESEEGDTENISLSTEGIAFSSCPLWRDSWAKLVEEIFPDEELQSITGPLITQMRSSRSAIVAHLAKFPAWSVSPFDDVVRALAARNIRLLEISGRNWQLVDDGNQWVIKPRVQENRTKIVQAFNNGEAEATLVTRAGNSGISLHAGQLFKDQRQRHLFEWDVAPDPSVRIQFWGRVRRKDQVMEPERSTLLVDTPFERRRLNRDTVKQRRLASHSGRSQGQTEQSWIGREGSFVAKEWLMFHPHARSMLDPGPAADVEKILTRSVVLSEPERLNLLTHLEAGVNLFSDWNPPRSSVWDKPSRVVRTQWWWGNGEHALHWQERVWSPRPTASKEQVFAQLQKHAQGLSSSAAFVMGQWEETWTKWWVEQPHQKTRERQQVLQWWKANAATFERGKGIEATDPHTLGRSRGIVLGWRAPSSNDGGVWSPSQIEMVVWLASMDEPMSLSLSAWMSPAFGHIKSIASAPSPAWFTGQSVPTTSLVLVGPPWSIAAWGARYAPRGELVHLHDEVGQWCWGWKMPQSWGWSQMLGTERELAGITHALAFVRQFPHAPIHWRWSPHMHFTATPQTGGLMLSGRIGALDCVSYPLLQKCRQMQWDDTKTQWFLFLPMQHVKWAFVHWFSFGAIPTVDAAFAQWHEKTWASFEGK